MSGKRKHILVVESNPTDAALMRGALDELPFCTSFLCRTLTEARAYISRTGIFKDEENYPSPDAIVTNLRLGEDSGYELLTWIKGVSSLQSVPIYVVARNVTAQDEVTVRGLVKQASQKPTDSSSMLKLFKQIAEEICAREE
jgi:CheY-like chemotaxis protein